MVAYEYQEQAAGLLRDTGRNLLIIAPTGAGKTEVGFTGLEVVGKGVVVEPTRALCFEKAQWLRQRFPEARVRLGNKDYSLTLTLSTEDFFPVEAELTVETTVIKTRLTSVEKNAAVDKGLFKFTKPKGVETLEFGN